MADISDVEQAVADAVTLILYPAGSSQSSIIGALCRVYRGWPDSATLNTDLSAEALNVTVVTDNDSGRITTRYLPEFQTKSSMPGVAARAAGATIIISGTPEIGDVVGALIDRVAYAHRIQAGENASLVAANLGRLIQVDRPTSVHGSGITVPGAGSVSVRAVCDNATSFESRRQEKDLRIICWCPNPTIRDAVAAAIDSALDQSSFLVLPDDQGTGRLQEHRRLRSSPERYALSARFGLYGRISNRKSFYSVGASDINGNINYG
jgi:hypothetical protein